MHYLSQFCCSVVSDSLWPHGLQHTRLLPCPSPTPRACSNSCPSSRWCHSTISSSVIPLFHCLQSLPASGSSPTNQFFPYGGQSIGASTSVSVLPMYIQELISYRMDWLDLLAVQGTLKSLQHRSSKVSILQHSAFFIFQFSHPFMTTRKTTALTRQTFVGKVMFLLSNMLSRLVIACLPSSKCILFSWQQSQSAVILEPKKIKSDTVSTVSPSISHEVMGPDAMIFIFWMLSFKPTFHSPLSLSSRGFWVPLHFLP